jgi:hypothetical protein
MNEQLSPAQGITDPDSLAGRAEAAAVLRGLAAQLEAGCQRLGGAIDVRIDTDAGSLLLTANLELQPVPHLPLWTFPNGIEIRSPPPMNAVDRLASSRKK